MSKKIIALISKKSGKVTLTPEGYTGTDCLAATKPLEEGLGIKEPERTMTAEYFQQEQQQQEIGGA